MDAALADPVRLITLLADAEDEPDAVRRLQATLGLSADQAGAVLGLQFGALTRARRARVGEELAVLRAEWGAPLPATLVFSGARSAVLTVDGEERRFFARRLEEVLDGVIGHLAEDVAAPRLRTVVVAVSGPPAAPVRITVSPASSASCEYADDVRG